MLTYRGPVYMRVHNSALPVPEVRRPFELGKAVIYEEGSDISIISTGNLTPNVLEAVEQLKASGLRPTVVGIHTLRPIDVTPSTKRRRQERSSRWRSILPSVD